MTKDKNKPNKDFSHVETDAFRATFIDNIEKAKELGKEYIASTTLRINLNEYLMTDEPVLKGCEIALQDFQPVLDDAKDEVLYIKIKPEDKTLIYHLTAHPDTLKALREISLEAKSKGFAMKKHIYVGGLNVRKMVDDLGYLILKNVSRTGMPINEICEAVERSNHLKKKARIVDGTRTKVEPDQAELLLKSGELILCIVGLYHLIKGWKGPSSPINFSDVRLVLPA